MVLKNDILRSCSHGLRRPCVNDDDDGSKRTVASWSTSSLLTRLDRARFDFKYIYSYILFYTHSRMRSSGRTFEP